jgi:hypothetical protein
VSVAVLTTLAPLHAEVFKCSGPNGVPVYQDTPCPTGKELRNFQTDPPEITVLPAPDLPVAAGAPAAPRNARNAAAPKAGAAAPDPKLRGDAGERRFVRPGMTEGEVLAKLGPPEVTSRGAKSGAQRWTYLPAAGDPETITTIQFASGVVTAVDRKASR